MTQKKGMLFVAFCYISWGLLPVFWKLLAAVDSFYILFSRVLWSLVFAGLYLIGTGRIALVRDAFSNRRAMGMSALAGVTICINWGTYIWAVNHGHLLDSSFGYYLNPLMVVLLGAFLFRERLSRSEWLAVTISALGVGYAILRSGTVPILAIVIGGTFAIYGALKKSVPFDSDISLFMETLIVAPVALIAVLFLELQAKGAIGVLHGSQFLLLPLSGLVTGLPLLVYSMGVKQCPYYLTGILMYLNPTLQFAMGLFYGEQIASYQIVAFVLIWIGVAISIADTLRQQQISLPE